MKKMKLIGGLTLSTAVLLTAIPASAAVVGTPLPTDGTVKFIQDDGSGQIVEPDPGKNPDEIITLPGEGVTGSGALRIQFVPKLKFGTQKGIVAAAIERPAELLTMMNEDGTAAHGKGKIAPFVQVTDGRGLEEAESSWTLTASATKFVSGSSDLGDSYITLEGSTLTTSMDDTAKAQEMVEGQDRTNNGKISTDDKNPTVVMKTKTGKSSNGYQVSNVFHDNYTKNMDYPAIAGAANSTNGVKFHKVKDVSPLKDALYTSTITWTLTDGF